MDSKLVKRELNCVLIVSFFAAAIAIWNAIDIARLKTETKTQQHQINELQQQLEGKD